MTLKICHISDTHGKISHLYGNYNVIVHSGDFLPDPPGNPIFKDEVGLWQLDWVKKNIENLKKWIGNNLFLFTLGNHDHVDPNALEKLLTDNNINSTCLHNIIVKINNISFYGFPYVPYINGSFAYERTEADMQDETSLLVKQCNLNKVDVLVCHSPPLNILDLSYSNIHLGSAAIASSLSKINAKKMPTHYLCGHIHHSRSITVKHGICFSNAACGQHIIEI